MLSHPSSQRAAPASPAKQARFIASRNPSWVLGSQAQRMHSGAAHFPGKATPTAVPPHIAHLRMESVRLRSGSTSPLRSSAAMEVQTSGSRHRSITAALLFSVAVASMGAFAFGYHLGVVNGPLEAIAADLGFGGDASLQGLVSGGGGFL
jgi:hypothetical protein